MGAKQELRSVLRHRSGRRAPPTSTQGGMRMRGAGPPSSWGHHRDEPSPHPTSSILSIAAPAPHFYWEGEAGSAGKISTGKKSKQFLCVFFFPCCGKTRLRGQMDRQTGIQPSVPSRAPSRGSRAGSLARRGSLCSSALKGFVVRAHCFYSRSRRIILELNPQEQLKMKKKQPNSKPQP